MKTNKIFKIVFSIVAILTIGLFALNNPSHGRHSTTQNYLIAAASEASSANASSANASSANASSANASSANASSANASLTDNIIFLQNFALNKTKVKPGERVDVTLTTSGACNIGTSIFFKGANGTTFPAQVQDITGKPYIVIPSSIVPTTYMVTDVLLVGRNSNNTSFTKQYSLTGPNSYNFNTTLIISSSDSDSSEEAKVKLKNISLDSKSAKIGEKVYINVEANQKLNSLKLVFTANDDKTFTVYAMDLSEDKPYIEIPSSSVGGVYSLTSAVVSSSKSSTAYSKSGGKDTERFNFNSVLEVIDDSESKFIYNNEDVTSDIITKLYNAPSGSEIIINAESNTFINEELFNAIKGKNKKLIINYKDNQIVFDGRDINNSKTIDIAMSVDNVSSNESIHKLVSDGVIVNFPDNGNLPGRALIKVKATEEVTNILKDTVYVYIYNKSSNNFCVIDTEVKKSADGYYEFTITHNSDFVITNKELDSKLVVKQSDDNIVSFQKSNKVYLLLIAIALVVIIIVLIVIIILRKKKNTKPNEKIEKKTEDKKKEETIEEDIDTEEENDEE